MKQKGFLLRSTRQLNAGAIGTGLVFVLYLGLSALGWLAVADGVSILGGLGGLYVLACVAAGRKRDKEAVSYNLLWGQAALTLLLLACGGLSVVERLKGMG